MKSLTYINATFALYPAVRNFPFATFRTMTFGEQPRRIAVVLVFFLASGQNRWRSYRCYFWQAANIGVRSTGPTHSKSDCAAWEFLTEKTDERRGRKKECRECYETRPPGWEYSLNWTLTVQTCCLKPVLSIRAQVCSEDRVKVIQWLVGAWAEAYIAQSCRWKGRSLNCPETRWREVKDSQQSRRVTTCTTGEACLSKTSTERTTESRRQSYRRPSGEVSCDSEEVQMAWRDCASLQPTVWDYFVTLL